MQLHKQGLQLMRLLLALFITTALASCSVNIKDEALYVDEGGSGATEVHFLSAGQTDLTKSEWDSIREGMVCESPGAWNDFKSEIEQLCTNSSCTYNQTQAIDAFFLRLELAEHDDRNR